MNELRVDLLGPVRAWRAGEELALGSAQRRAVLAVLASRANQVVSRSELVDAVWGESAPASANGGIHTYVSALRAVLEPGRSRDSWQVLVSAGAGYLLRLADGDLERFTALRERARECQLAQDVPGELAALDAALGLWRGDPLDGVPGPYAEAQRARLTDLRLSTVERRARLLVETGRAIDVVDELRPLCAAHPLREGLHQLLMHALHVVGQRAEALAVYRRVHAVTVERLGVEPGPGLTGLYGEIRRAGAPDGRLPRAVRHLTEPARKLLGWAALLGEVFTAEDLAAVLPGLDFLGEVVDAGLLAECEGRLWFRQRLVRNALRDRHPTAVRAALHRQLAEALAGAGAPADRVAEQLVQAPAEADPWLCEWLATHGGTLRPHLVMRLSHWLAIDIGLLAPRTTTRPLAPSAGTPHEVHCVPRRLHRTPHPLPCTSRQVRCVPRAVRRAVRSSRAGPRLGFACRHE